MPSKTQLEYLLAVAKLKHFGQAAQSCHVSQPSLSMQIQKVEDELGFKIFNRNKKPIELTPKGDIVIAQAQKIISEYHRLLQISREENQELKGEYHLGVIPTLSNSMIPLFVKEFSQKHPKVDLFISELTTENILQRLKLDELDAGLLATPLSEAFLEKFVLFYEGFSVFCSPQHPLLKKTRLQTQDLLNHHDLWILSDGHCFKNQVLNFCGIANQMNVFSNVHFQSGSLQTLTHLVQTSGGYTFLPQMNIDKMTDHEKSYIRPFSKPIPSREVSLVYRPGHWKQDITLSLSQLIRSLIPESVQATPDKNHEILAIDPA